MLSKDAITSFNPEFQKCLKNYHDSLYFIVFSKSVALPQIRIFVFPTTQNYSFHNGVELIPGGLLQYLNQLGCYSI